MVSDEILDFWFLILGIIVAVSVIILAIWVLDRSRRNTPAFALGRAMQDAWAALQAHRINTGKAAPMPTTVDELENVALTSMHTRGFDPRLMGAQASPEEALAKKAEALAKQKEELDQITPH